MSTPSTQTSLTNKRTKACLGKWLIPELGQGKYVVLENEERPEKGWGHIKRVQEPA